LALVGHVQSVTAYLRICLMPQLVSRSRARRASSARLDGTASLQNRLCSDRSKLASHDELELAHEPRAIFPALARALASAHLRGRARLRGFAMSFAGGLVAHAATRAPCEGIFAVLRESFGRLRLVCSRHGQSRSASSLMTSRACSTLAPTSPAL
jgi:hypothetical protein